MIEFGYGAQQPIAKAAPPMSDKKLAHRKRAQAALSVGTSTGALGATGLLAGGALLSAAAKNNVGIRVGAGGAKWHKSIRNQERAQRVGQKMKAAAAPLSIATGGVGALGGYNFAAIQRAEARKRQPMAKAFDSERSRQKRLEIYERSTRRGGQVAGYGGAAALGVSGAMAGAHLAGNKKLQGSFKLVGRNLKQAGKLRGVRAAGVVGAAGLGLGGASIASRVGSDRIKSYRNNRGRSYSPRYDVQGW